jgi:hypothetical protein
MTNQTTHIHILLDRSGSMASIAPDVIGGFNTFLSAQQADGPDARITLVQFDNHNPQEVLLAGVPIAQAKPLGAEQYQPRGGTPLLDATGRLIERARLEANLRGANGLPKEDIVFVSITDGEENQSREYDLERIRQLIAACEAEGWTFVFLSAALDAYGEARRMGIKESATQSFEATGASTRMAMHSLSESMSKFRDKRRFNDTTDVTDFFADGKPAEEKRNKPGSDHKA